MQLSSLYELSHCYVGIAVLCCCCCTNVSKLHKEALLNAPAALCIVTLNDNDNECSNTSSAFSYDLDLHQIIQPHRSQHTFLFNSDHCITIYRSPWFACTYCIPTFQIPGSLTVLTSDTTSWDMSLWMAARHSWVIFGSLVPQPIRKGCTTSELFSFRAAEKGRR